MEKSRNNRGRNMPRPCAYVSLDTTQIERKWFYGVFEREK